MSLENRLRSLLKEGRLDLPLPGSGATAKRHLALAEFAREDVSLGRLAEAHTDAIAILAEAGRVPQPNQLYGVWASESSTPSLRLGADRTLTGSKPFCSGASLVDRALVTIGCPDHLLIDVDLRGNDERIRIETAGWISPAFAGTCTATVHFNSVPIAEESLIGPSRWYLSRPGFWNGACGPAACWAGGAVGLLDYARCHARENPHDVAHLGRMHAAMWASYACLEQAGREIDADPQDVEQAQIRALALRHTIEQLCTDLLQHFGRAYGPRPLAFEETISRRYREVELYLRQCHAERDLESLGRESAHEPVFLRREMPEKA